MLGYPRSGVRLKTNEPKQPKQPKRLGPEDSAVVHRCGIGSALRSVMFTHTSAGAPRCTCSTHNMSTLCATFWCVPESLSLDLNRAGWGNTPHMQGLCRDVPVAHITCVRHPLPCVLTFGVAGLSPSAPIRTSARLERVRGVVCTIHGHYHRTRVVPALCGRFSIYLFTPCCVLC